MAYCPYCMSPVQPGSLCPHCGRDPASYQPASHHYPPGRLLRERYLVGRALGEGGFGITYLGIDTVLERRVAVKEYFPNVFVRREASVTLEVTCYTDANRTVYEEGREKFLQEARAMARFDKVPEIVQVLDFFPANNTAYIVMEFLEGNTLRDLLKQQGRIPAKKLLKMMEPVLRALEAVHNVGIIHRDISPDNLMLLNDGQIKLLDFGCARDVDDSHTMTVMLKHGYAPLEQYTGYNQGPWTDVYALSATLYCCLTGKAPPRALERFGNESDPLIPPTKLGAALSREQENALLRGLASEPKHRWQSVADLYAALYGAVADGYAPLKEEEEKTALLTEIIEPEPEPPRKTEPEPEPAPPRKPEPQSASQQISESQPEPAPERKHEHGLQPAPEPGHEPGPQSVPEQKHEPGPQSVPEQKHEPGPQFAPEQRYKPGPQPEPQPAPQRKIEPEPVPRWESYQNSAQPAPNPVPPQRKPPKTMWIAAVCCAAALALVMLIRGMSDTAPAGPPLSLEIQSNVLECGLNYVMGVNEDGTVLCAGSGIDPQYPPYVPDDIHELGRTGNDADIIAVSSGFTHFVVLREDGTVAVDVIDEGDDNLEACKWNNIVAVSAGGYHTVGLKKDGTVVVAGSPSGGNNLGQCKVSKWSNIVAISAGGWHTVGLKKDGTVVATGNFDKDVNGWSDIAAIDAGNGYTVGLKKDGTVVAAGGNYDGQCDVRGWTDIVAVSAGGGVTAGLKKDGTVVAAGDIDSSALSGWSNIVAVSAGEGYVAGLKSDGTVLTTSSDPDLSSWVLRVPENGIPAEPALSLELQPKVLDCNYYSDYVIGVKEDGTVVSTRPPTTNLHVNVEDWSDIVAIDTAGVYKIGLKRDGTVVAADATSGIYNGVRDWSDIAAVAAGSDAIAGLKRDGTVVAIGDDSISGSRELDSSAVNDWSDIVAVAAGWSHVVGLKKDGTVLTTLSDLDLSSWVLRVPE